ncbi:MAG: hypothetical protein M3070_13375 [Actinomycetota bacterium]|nr:hypothetical protein [Actinomycetota bacterium]
MAAPVGDAATCTRAPHSRQNFEPTARSVPHDAHPAATGVPHSGQNFESTEIFVPHDTHVTRTTRRS